jgi:hypothetical protein
MTDENRGLEMKTLIDGFVWRRREVARLGEKYFTQRRRDCREFVRINFFSAVFAALREHLWSRLGLENGFVLISKIDLITSNFPERSLNHRTSGFQWHFQMGLFGQKNCFRFSVLGCEFSSRFTASPFRIEHGGCSGYVVRMGLLFIVF